MNELNVCRVKVLLLLSCFVFAWTSCINEEFDMSGDRLNLEVTPFQEGLVFPLGSTDSIRLADLLKGVSADLLDTTRNYMVRVADTMDLSENLPDLDEMLDIEDISLKDTLDFKLDNVDVSDVKVEEDVMEFPYDLASSLEVPEIPTPEINESIPVEAGIWKYAPDMGEVGAGMDFQNQTAEPQDIAAVNTDAILAGLTAMGQTLNDNPVVLDDYINQGLIEMNLELERQEFSFKLDMDLPEGITSVSDIILDDRAAIIARVSLESGFLHGGEIVPHINVDLHEVFNIENSSNGVVNLGDHLSLVEEHHYSDEHRIDISSFAIDEDDWTYDENTKKASLHKTFKAYVWGEVKEHDLFTTTNLLTDPTKNKMTIHVDLEFENLEIKGFDANLERKEIPNDQTIALTLEDITIPSEIEKISYVSFTEGSGFNLDVTANNLRAAAGHTGVPGLDAVLESIYVTFPDWLVVEGADADNRVAVISADDTENRNLADGDIHRFITVKQINLPAPRERDGLDEEIERFITFGQCEVLVEALAVASGTVDTQTLPTTEAEDVSIVVAIDSDLEVDNYEVHIYDYPYELEIPKEDIEIEIPEDVAELHEIIIYPAPDKNTGDKPAIVINMDIPDLGDLKLRPMDEKGLKIIFPKMIEFDSSDFPASYNYGKDENGIPSIHFRYDPTKPIEDQIIPSVIELPIDKLIIIPELDETDNKYYSRGSVEILGGVTLDGGAVHKEEIEHIQNGGQIMVTATIPEIVPEDLHLESYQTNIEEHIELAILEPGSLPEELLSVGKINLENTKIIFGVNAEDLPELGDATLELVVDVTLPEFIKIKGYDTNVLHLTGELDENKQLNFEELDVEYLDLADVDLKEGLAGTVDVDVNVVLTNAMLNVDEWLADDLQVYIDGGVVDINITDVTAKVGYDIDMAPQNVDLSSFTDMMGNMGVDAVLAFNHAHIALEVNTNLGVPINASLELLPYYDGQVNESKKVTADLQIQTTADEEPMQIWIAEDNGDTRMPDGYTLVPVNGLLDLFKQIPEKLEIKIVGGTDREKDCVMDLREELALSISYAFELPLEFGEGFEVVYKTAFSGLPDIVGEVLASGLKVKLMGDIMNALPLGLDLRIGFLDEDGNEIELSEGAGTQAIKPCKYDALEGKVSASENDLGIEIAVKNPEDARGIKALQLEFNANSENAVGIPVTKEAYLQAILQIALPDGVTVDLKELMNTNNNAQ